MRIARRRFTRGRTRKGLKRRRVTRKRTVKRAIKRVKRINRRRPNPSNPRVFASKKYSLRKWPNHHHLADHALRKLKSIYQMPFQSGGVPNAAGRVLGNDGYLLQSLAPSNFYLVRMTDPYTPGVDNNVTPWTGPALAMPVSSGFSEITSLYRYWQVKKAKLRVSIQALSVGQESIGAPLQPRVICLMAPLASQLAVASTQTMTYDQWLLQPGVIKKDLGLVAGDKPRVFLSHYCDCAHVHGLNQITYGQISDTGTYNGVGNVPPLFNNYWLVMLYTPDSAMLNTTTRQYRFSIRFEATYYTEFYGRRTVNYGTAEEKEVLMQQTEELKSIIAASKIAPEPIKEEDS